MKLFPTFLMLTCLWSDMAQAQFNFFWMGPGSESKGVVTNSLCDFAVDFQETTSVLHKKSHQDVLAYLREKIDLVDINNQVDLKEGGKRLICVLVREKDREKNKAMLIAYIENDILAKTGGKNPPNAKVFDCAIQKEAFECINAFEFTIRPGKENVVVTDVLKKLRSVRAHNAIGKTIKPKNISFFSCDNMRELKFLMNLDQTDHCSIQNPEDADAIARVLSIDDWRANTIFFETCPPEMKIEHYCNPKKLRNF